jgi:hypothetical protein
MAHRRRDEQRRWVETDATGDHDDLTGPGETTSASQHAAATTAGHGHGASEHGGEEVLGPIDWAMWGVGVLGVVLGLVVAALMAFSAAAG